MPADTTTTPAPISILRETVEEGWTDYNGHMNVAYFALVFDKATHMFYETVGLGKPYRERTNHTTFAVECHITYQREGAIGDRIEVTSQILGFDDKRFHYFNVLHNLDKGHQMATFEQLALHVDLATRKVVAWPEDVHRQLADLQAAHSQLPRPPQVGSVMGVRPKSAKQ